MKQLTTILLLFGVLLLTVWSDLPIQNPYPEIQINKDTLLESTHFKDLRIVCCTGEGITKTYTIHKDQVELLTKALITLQENPEKNIALTSLPLFQEISVLKPSLAGPRWWATKDLATNQDPNGVLFFEFSGEKQILWQR
jgi:hypothetical protein